MWVNSFLKNIHQKASLKSLLGMKSKDLDWIQFYSVWIFDKIQNSSCAGGLNGAITENLVASLK